MLQPRAGECVLIHKECVIELSSVHSSRAMGKRTRNVQPVGEQSVDECFKRGKF